MVEFQRILDRPERNQEDKADSISINTSLRELKMAHQQGILIRLLQKTGIPSNPAYILLKFLFVYSIYIPLQLV